MQRAAGKGDMPVEDEAYRKAYAKGKKDGSDVGRDGPESQMHIGLVKNIVEAEPVGYDVQHGAGSTAGCITESLQRHQPAERRVKEINKGSDAIFYKP